MSTTVADLPFNRLLELEVVDSGEALLRLPAGERYHNHLGTVHAGALLSLVDATSGEFLLKRYGAETGLVPVVRRIEAKFRKPANAAVTGTVGVSDEALMKFENDLAAKGRALLEIPVNLHDASGTHVLSATVEWFVTRQAQV